jgi:serine protease AprX
MASDKISPRARALVSKFQNDGNQVPVIVRFHSNESKRKFYGRSADVSIRSTRKDFHLIPATAMLIAQEEIESLAAMDEIAEVWYDEPVHITLNNSVPSLNVPQIWQEMGFQGTGITICVIDTGLDVDHLDFTGRIGAVADFTGLGSADDGHGHGTHVASIAAGSGQASDGLYRGVAPAATLMAAKVLDNRGDGRMSDVMAGIEWATENGAQIMILSLGTNDGSEGEDALIAMVDTVVAMDKIVIVAAGNDGPRGRTINSPAAAPEAITVGATVDTDGLADFSSRGPTADEQVKPEVVAPGTNIIAARANGTSFGTPIDDHYTRASGTSMAAPHVAGICALILEANSSLKPADVKWILMDTAVDLGMSPNAQGTGRVDALAAVQAAQGIAGRIPPPSSSPPSEPDPAPSSEPAEESVAAPPTSRDKPSSPSPSGCLGSLLSLISVTGILFLQ